MSTLNLQKLLNPVTELINFYSNELIPHSLVIGIPMFLSSAIQINIKTNIMDVPEYKKVVIGFMIFNIIMFLQFISRRKNNFSKINIFLLFLVYIVCSSTVIALINLDEIPHNVVNVIMLFQGVFTPVFNGMHMLVISKNNLLPH